jgi:hypothetical protein
MKIIAIANLVLMIICTILFDPETEILDPIETPIAVIVIDIFVVTVLIWLDKVMKRK